MSELMKDGPTSADQRQQEAELFGSLYYSTTNATVPTSDKVGGASSGADLYDIMIEEERRKMLNNKLTSMMRRDSH